jgi:hypothetical protein
MTRSLTVLKEIVSLQTNVSREAFDSGRNFPRIKDAQKLFVLLAMDVCKYRQVEVSEFIKKDHSTVSEALKKANELVSVDKRFEYQFYSIKRALQEWTPIDELSHDAVLVRLKIIEIELTEKIKEIDHIIKSIS